MFRSLSRDQKLLIALSFLLILGLFLRFGFAGRSEIIISTEGDGQGATGEMNDGESIAAEDDDTNKDTQEAAEIVIHVAGAVVNPGVYTLKDGARYHMAVDIAGGALPKADLDRVNLAKLLVDGQRVYIPYVGEEGVPDLYDAAGVTGKININSASSAELQSLPGIGEVRAKAIISYRERHGSFEKMDDLLNVSGIGSKTLENLRELITLR